MIIMVMEGGWMAREVVEGEVGGKRCRQMRVKQRGNTERGRTEEAWSHCANRKGVDHSRGQATPPAGLTQSLCPKLGSILCHGEAEPWAGSLETELFCCCSVSLWVHSSSHSAPRGRKRREMGASLRLRKSDETPVSSSSFLLCHAAHSETGGRIHQLSEWRTGWSWITDQVLHVTISLDLIVFLYGETFDEFDPLFQGIYSSHVCHYYSDQSLFFHCLIQFYIKGSLWSFR